MEINTEGEYNPYEQRELKDPINNCEAFMNILRGCIGSGLLALPIAFRFSGVAMGSALVVLTSALLIHTLDTLVIRKYFEENQISSFVLIMMLQFGNCMSYIIVGATCLESFANSFPGPKYLNRTHFILVTMVPYFFTLFVMNLKSMSPVSLAANITMFIALCLSLDFLFSDLGNISDRKVVAHPKTWPISIATVVFSIQAIGVISHVEHNMKTPERFRGCCGMFPLSMYIVTILNIVIGFFGYWRYGSKVMGNYILNIPTKTIEARIIQVLLFFTMLVSYGLNAVVAVDIIWDEVLENRITKHIGFWNFLLKVGTLLITHAGTIGIPNLAIIVSLTGAASICTLSIIYPMLMDIFEKYDVGYGPRKWILVKDIIIIIIGFVCFGMGLTEIILETMKYGTKDD